MCALVPQSLLCVSRPYVQCALCTCVLLCSGSKCQFRSHFFQHRFWMTSKCQHMHGTHSHTHNGVSSIRGVLACEKSHRFLANDTTVHKICISTVHTAGARCAAFGYRTRERVVSRDSTRTYTSKELSSMMCTCVRFVHSMALVTCNSLLIGPSNHMHTHTHTSIRFGSWDLLASSSRKPEFQYAANMFFSSCKDQRLHVNLVHFFHLLPLSIRMNTPPPFLHLHLATTTHIYARLLHVTELTPRVYV